MRDTDILLENATDQTPPTSTWLAVFVGATRVDVGGVFCLPLRDDRGLEAQSIASGLDGANA